MYRMICFVLLATLFVAGCSAHLQGHANPGQGKVHVNPAQAKVKIK